MRQMKLKTINVRKRGAVGLLAEVYPTENVSVLCEIGTYTKVLKVNTTEIEDLRRVAESLRHTQEHVKMLKQFGAKALPGYDSNLEVASLENGHDKQEAHSNGHDKSEKKAPVKVKRAGLASAPPKVRKPSAL